MSPPCFPLTRLLISSFKSPACTFTQFNFTHKILQSNGSFLRNSLAFLSSFFHAYLLQYLKRPYLSIVTFQLQEQLPFLLLLMLPFLKFVFSSVHIPLALSSLFLIGTSASDLFYHIVILVIQCCHEALNLSWCNISFLSISVFYFIQ